MSKEKDKNKEKHGVDYEADASLEEVVEYLKSITARLEGGEIHVVSGSKQVALTPHEPIRLSVRAREKEGEQSLRIEIAWEATTTSSTAEGLQITGPVEPSRPRAKK